MKPRNKNMKNDKALECSFINNFSSFISSSFFSSNLIVLYIKGMQAKVVKKTIINEACSLNIHKDKKIAIVAYKNPKKKSSTGFFSAFFGEIKDSRTISISSFLFFK